MNRVLPMPASRAEIPDAVDLVLDPELAPLVLLDAAAHVLIQALVAANPEMLHRAERRGARLQPATCAALRVVAACRDLHDTLDAYRVHVSDRRLRDDSDDIPF